jgi:hypothetical protein
MKKIHILLLKWICKKLVKQSSIHKTNIASYFQIMREAVESEFTEDNKPTLDSFLQECFDSTTNKNNHHANK